MGNKKLATLGPLSRRKEFFYSGSILERVVLQQAGNPPVSARLFAEALRYFAGKKVYGGFKQDNPQLGGFGDWLQQESSKLNSRKLYPRHGSFVAAILCAEAGVKSGWEGNAVVLYFPK